MEQAPTSVDKAVVRPLALVAEVHAAILDRITSLAIAPGARINIDTLARELGVSQTPVREALSRLEADGLVHKTHLVGHRAGPKLTRPQIEQLFELRLMIEPEGAAMAARNLAEDSREAIARLHAEMGSAGESAPTYSEFARKDAELHATIAAASGNAFLADALAKLHTHVHIFRLVVHTRVTAEAIVEHAALLEALLRGDPAASRKAMRDHIQASRSRVLTLLPR
jgi:DNA-binding GntR family transcriptional regulator